MKEFIQLTQREPCLNLKRDYFGESGSWKREKEACGRQCNI